MSHLDTSKNILKYFELETNFEKAVYFERLCKGFLSRDDVDGLEKILEHFSKNNDIDTKVFYKIYNKILEINNIIDRLDPIVYSIGDISYDSNFMPGHMRGLDTFNMLSTLGDLSKINNPNEDYFMKKNIRMPFNNFKFLTVFSCDERYFDLFYDGLYKSFMKYKHKNEAIFINVLNPRLDQIEFMKRSFDSSIGFSVSYTTQMTQSLLAFSTCLRYLTAIDLMNLYDCPILVSEMDTVFKSSPYENFLKEPEHNKIVCMNTPGIQLPWQKYLAGFTLIKNNKIGKNFLNDMCKIINHFFHDVVNHDHNLEYWYIDQNILLYLFRTLEYERENNWGLRNRIYEAVK